MQNFHQHNKIFAGNLYPEQKCGKIRLTKSKPVLFFYFEKENRIMILAIDIGNTTVALGGIRDGRVCFVARMDTVRTRTAAEYRAEMDKIFAHRRHPERPMRFEGAVLTSVVPQITGALAECARHYTGKKPVIVSPDIRTGLTMGVDEPRAVGKDRLVDAAYAAANFPLPVITVDLGTATTFNVVDKNRVFRGGVICPGLSTGLRALGERCAQLPQVHLGSPKKPSAPIPKAVCCPARCWAPLCSLTAWCSALKRNWAARLRW